MPKSRRASVPHGSFDLARLSIDAWVVACLRLVKLGRGGPAAALEIRHMVVEKTAAAIEAQFAIGMALATGATKRAAACKAVSPYRRRVRANRRRLMRQG